MFNCVLIRQLLPELERERVGSKTFSTWKRDPAGTGSWPFSPAVFDREGHISHITSLDHSFSRSKAKCSHPLGADPRRDILQTFALWLSNLGELVRWVWGRWSSWSQPIYFITIDGKQSVCVCSSLLMKQSDSGKNHLRLNPVVIAGPLSPVRS